MPQTFRMTNSRSQTLLLLGLHGFIGLLIAGRAWGITLQPVVPADLTMEAPDVSGMSPRTTILPPDTHDLYSETAAATYGSTVLVAINDQNAYNALNNTGAANQCRVFTSSDKATTFPANVNLVDIDNASGGTLFDQSSDPSLTVDAGGRFYFGAVTFANNLAGPFGFDCTANNAFVVTSSADGLSWGPLHVVASNNAALHDRPWLEADDVAAGTIWAMWNAYYNAPSTSVCAEYGFPQMNHSTDAGATWSAPIDVVGARVIQPPLRFAVVAENAIVPVMMSNSVDVYRCSSPFVSPSQSCAQIASLAAQPVLHDGEHFPDGALANRINSMPGMWRNGDGSLLLVAWMGSDFQIHTSVSHRPVTSCDGPTYAGSECLPEQACVSKACQCVGDCNGDGVVTSGELATMVKIINGVTPLSACLAADANGNGEVGSNEYTMAINNLNFGCPGTPFPGTTWSAPEIAKPSGREQFFPMVSMNPTTLCFYEQITPNVRRYAVVCATSTDGITWGGWQTVSNPIDQMTNITNVFTDGGYTGDFLGDYMGDAARHLAVISERENPDANVNPYAQTYIEMDNAPSCQIDPGAPAGSALLIPPVVLGLFRRRGWRRWMLALLALIPLLISRPVTAQLIGDCNQDGCVRVNELLVCVNIALGEPSSRPVPPSGIVWQRATARA